MIETTYDEAETGDLTHLLAWTYRPGESLGVDVIVRELADGRFQLEWGDRVANSWIENYDDPAVAFARLAVLLRAEQNLPSGASFFRHQATDDGVWTSPDGGDGPAAFVADASAFLDGQLT